MTKKRKKQKKRRESRKKDWPLTMQRKQPSKLSLPNHHCFLMSNLGMTKQIRPDGGIGSYNSM